MFIVLVQLLRQLLKSRNWIPVSQSLRELASFFWIFLDLRPGFT